MIVITGTPGTGKTTIAKLISKRLDLPLIETNKLVRKKKLYTRKEKDSLVVDLKKLKKELHGFKGVVEGHVLCEIPLPATIIILRASPRSIKKRLSPRRYSKQKLRDNIESEALDYCLFKAKKNYRRVIQLDTTGLSPSKAAAKTLRYLNENLSDSVDWSDYFLNARS